MTSRRRRAVSFFFFAERGWLDHNTPARLHGVTGLTFAELAGFVNHYAIELHTTNPTVVGLFSTELTADASDAEEIQLESPKNRRR
jgi:hypothetical protein